MRRDLPQKVISLECGEDPLTKQPTGEEEPHLAELYPCMYTRVGDSITDFLEEFTKFDAQEIARFFRL